jgi:O-antigen ligase
MAVCERRLPSLLDNSSWTSLWELQSGARRVPHDAPFGAGTHFNGTITAPRTSLATRENTTLLQKATFFFLWVLAFAMPWQNALVFPGFGTITRVVGAAAFGLGLLGVLDSGRLRVPVLWHVSMVLFVMWASLTYLWSFTPWRTRVVMVTYVQLVAMVWLVWQFAQTYRAQLLLLRAVVLGTFISCIATLIEYSEGTAVHYHRYAGAGFNPDELALILAMCLPISLFLITRERGKAIVWVYGAQVVLAISTILLTASRGPVLACVGTLVIIPVVVRQMTVGQKAAGVAFVVLAGVVAFLVVPATSWTRLGTIGGELRGGTLNQRTMIWEAGWEVFGQSPLRGIGAASFAPAVQHSLGMPFRGQSEEEGEPNVELVAHNSFLSVLVEQGVIGFGLFLAVLLALAVPVLRLPVLEKMFWLSFLVTWVIGASTLTYEDRKLPWLLFGILTAQVASRIPNFSRSVAREKAVGRSMKFCPNNFGA